MPRCCLCSVCGSNYDLRFVAYQLIIQLSWCEGSIDVDSFLLYRQPARSARIGNRVVSSVAELIRLNCSKYSKIFLMNSAHIVQLANQPVCYHTGSIGTV